MKNSERKRYCVLDAIRGIAILNMIAYHASWDIVNICHVDWQWFRSDAAHIWQQFICCTFILLSGFCQALGRRSFKRGAVVFLLGAAISVITAVVVPRNRVMFGVLTLIGSAMLLIAAAEPLLKKCSSAWGAVVSYGVFVVFRHANQGYAGIGGMKFVLPTKLYKNMSTAYLGFPAKGFHSTDYFPLIPWLFLFLSGYFICRTVQKRGLPLCLEKSIIKPVEWLGKHSLIIYIIHQPVLYVIFTLMLYNKT